jgi:hypothetical protein
MEYSTHGKWLKINSDDCRQGGLGTVWRYMHHILGCVWVRPLQPELGWWLSSMQLDLRHSIGLLDTTNPVCVFCRPCPAAVRYSTGTILQLEVGRAMCRHPSRMKVQVLLGKCIDDTLIGWWNTPHMASGWNKQRWLQAGWFGHRMEIYAPHSRLCVS